MDRAVLVYTTYPSLVEAERAGDAVEWRYAAAWRALGVRAETGSVYGCVALAESEDAGEEGGVSVTLVARAAMSCASSGNSRR